MMGRGKTEAAINYINNSKPEKRFIVITPYLKEVKRFETACKKKKFKQPYPKSGSKLHGIKELIKNKENIVSTHALFQRFNKEIIHLLQEEDYTLILDEVTEVVSEFYISDHDLSLLQENFIDTDEKTGLLKWRKSEYKYEGKFSQIKDLCEINSLVSYSGSVILWLFPVEVFSVFKEVYVLTYMFESQIQRYYFDFYGIKYEYGYVKGHTLKDFRFSDMPDEKKKIIDYRKLIRICYHEKLNEIGKDWFALSKRWYTDMESSDEMSQLQKNLINYFRNICNAKCSEVLWTTFTDYRIHLKGCGYSKKDCFLELNARATNDKKDRKYLAYTVNRFFSPVIKNFFLGRGVKVDEEGYALSEMVQFIWRSAIREGKPIFVYIPSKRMRCLLREWINKISTVS